MKSDDLPSPMKGRFVSILDFSLSPAVAPQEQPIAILTIGLPGGEVEVLNISSKDVNLLRDKLNLSIERGSVDATPPKGNPSIDLPDQNDRVWLTSTFDSQPRKKPFISDLRPTGMTIRKWVDGKLQVYDILGGYALPEVRHYMLLCRHGARPKCDFNMRAIQVRGKLITSVADDHPTALTRQPYMWRWFSNCGTRKPFALGDPLVYVRKLSLNALKKLIGKRR